MMAGKGSVKLSIYSTFDDGGTKRAERALSSFTKKFGEVDAATGALKLDDTTQKLVNQSVQADITAQKWGKVSDSLGKAGEKMTIFATVPIVAAGTAAFTLASDFESSMSRVSGALNDPSADMEALRQLAIQTGQDTVFSAAEAGAAMEELAKGGLTAADIQGGALNTTMDLAAAGNLALADAANIVVQSMGAFGLTADQTSEAANALAGSAAASSADVSDLSQGLSQASAQANLAGWSIQDTTAVLGGFADAGIKGSDAGTSLKTMLQRLSAPTDDAAKAISDLGINTRDGNGNLLDAAGIADELQTKMGGLSSAQRDAAMQTIFGSDASRAAATMMNLGREGVEKYTAATNDQTAAQRLADSQMGDSERAIENMKGAVETAAIQFGTALAPSVTDAAGAVSEAAEAFSNLDEHTQGVIVSTAAAVAAAGPLLSVGSKVADGVRIGYRGYAKFSAELAKFSAGSGAAAKAAGALNTVISGMVPVALVAAATVGVLQIVRFASGIDAARERLDKTTESVVSFGDRMGNAKSIVSDMDATLTSSGSTIGSVTTTIQEKEQAITDIIAAAMSEQRALRDEDIAAIEQYNAEIERLESEKIQAYQSGMQGVSDSVEAEGQITLDRAAELFATIKDYQATALDDLDDYHNTKLQKLNEQYTIEGSLTYEQYQGEIKKENEYYEQSRKNIEDSASVSEQAIASHAETITGFSEEQQKAIELIADPWWKSTASVVDAINALVTDGTSGFVAMQLALAENGGKITRDNGEMLDTLLSQFENLPVGLEEDADKAMRALAEGLDSELGIDVANSTAQQIIEAYRSKTDGAREAGGETSQNYADGLSERTQAAIDAAAGVTGLSVEKLGEAASQAGIKGDDATYAFAAALANGATLAEAAAIANASSATGGLGTGDGGTPATNLASAYSTTLSNSAWQAFQPGTQLASQASDGAKSVDGSGAGDNFASGFINTIGDWAQSAWDAGWSFISNALAGGNAAQESRSPAKKTKEMAKWNALGFVNEMESRESDAYASGRSFIASALAGQSSVDLAEYSNSRAQVTAALSSYQTAGTQISGTSKVSESDNCELASLLSDIADRITTLDDGMGEKIKNYAPTVTKTRRQAKIDARETARG